MRTEQQYRDREEWNRLMSESIAEAEAAVPGTKWELSSTYDDLPMLHLNLEWDDELNDPALNEKAQDAISKAFDKRGLVPGGVTQAGLAPADGDELGTPLSPDDLARFGHDILMDVVAEAEAEVPGSHWMINWPGGGDIAGAQFILVWDIEVGGDSVFVDANNAMRRALARHGVTVPKKVGTEPKSKSRGPVSSVAPNPEPDPLPHILDQPVIIDKHKLINDVVRQYRPRKRRRGT